MSRFARTTIAIVLFGHLFMVLAAAALPGLHETIHHDADEGEHECAVTLFLSGAANDTALQPVLRTVTLRCVQVLPAEAAPELFLANVEGRIRERAPPLGAI